MDISGNFEAIMMQYNQNMYEYNQNIRIYLEIMRAQQRRQSSPRDSYAYYEFPIRNRTIPLSNGTNNGLATSILNSLFSDAFSRAGYSGSDSDSRGDSRGGSDSRGDSRGGFNGRFTNGFGSGFRFGTTPLFRDFQDVVVHPTDEQIRNATEIIQYDENNTSILNTSCPITLEAFQPGEHICRIKHCSHSFKRTAITDWFRRNVRCPVCRFDIRETDREDVSQSDEREEEQEEVGDDNSEFNDVIDELLYEASPSTNRRSERSHTEPISSPPRSQTPSRTQSSFTQNLTNAIRNFVSNEIHNLPFDMNSAATELFYTFDIPLTFDISRNTQR